jgi:23S rRNA pseudouridine1911/1915/1917 synthase
VRTLLKPAGLPVFPPHDDPAGDCLLARLYLEEPGRRELSWPEGFEGGLAHRLDNDTSGALLVADDPDELAVLRARFAGGLRKEYRMFAARDVPWAENRCDRPIGHDKEHRGRMVVQRGPNTPHRGKWYPADTAFVHVRGRLWDVVITTGVMHQIRVHAAFLGIPLAGDKRYGGGPRPEQAPDGAAFCLHHVGIRGLTTEVPMPPWANFPA